MKIMPAHVNAMRPILYYANADGAGHLQRARAFRNRCQTPVVIATDARAAHPRDGELGLPPFCAQGSAAPAELTPEPAAEHCAPLFAWGNAERAAALASAVARLRPALAVVDVCVETAALLRLCGVPTVYVRQHGKRVDSPHTIAYRSAVALLASYPRELEVGRMDDWRTQKTVYHGFLCEPAKPAAQPSQQAVFIASRGQHRLQPHAIKAFARAMPGMHCHVLGVEGEDSEWVHFHGWVPSAAPWLDNAQWVIGTAGTNTVGEALLRGVRLIAVMEARPFGEQREKGRALRAQNWALPVAALPTTPRAWEQLLRRAERLTPPAPNATAGLDSAAQWLDQLAAKFGAGAERPAA